MVCGLLYSCSDTEEVGEEKERAGNDHPQTEAYVELDVSSTKCERKLSDHCKHCSISHSGRKPDIMAQISLFELVYPMHILCVGEVYILIHRQTYARKPCLKCTANNELRLLVGRRQVLL